jgi:hypothetical protein
MEIYHCFEWGDLSMTKVELSIRTVVVISAIVLFFIAFATDDTIWGDVAVVIYGLSMCIIGPIYLKAGLKENKNWKYWVSWAFFVATGLFLILRFFIHLIV